MATQITGSQRTPRIWMPTKKQLTETYKAIAAAAFKNNTAKRISKPPVTNPNRYPSYDITPRGMMDLTKTIYNIKGTLYQRNSGMSPEGIRSQWYKIGPAPFF